MSVLVGEPVAAVQESRDSLWRDRRFVRLWSGVTVSQFGDRVSDLAVPLIAVGVLHASTMAVSVLAALVWTPNLLAVFAGAWVDQQRSKQRLLVIADLVRAVALVSLPAACLYGAVTMAQLFVVAVVVGAAGVLFNTAYAPFFAHLVPRAAYLEANSRLSASRSASYLGGPALGGMLVQLLGAPVAVLADALSFAGSALLVGRIRVAAPPPAERPEPMLQRARAGLAFVVRHPVLRASLGCCTTVNFFTFIPAGLLVLFANRELGLSAGTIGFAMGIAATGSLLGAVLAPRMARAIGMGRTVVLGAALFPAPLALLALAGGPLWTRAAVLAGVEFLSGAGVMLFDVNLNSLQASVVPDELRSRVSGAFSTVNYGIRPLGALAGGALGSAFGLRETMVVAGVGGALSVLWLLRSPIPGVREIAS
ncbi:MFS transporter [Streptomyces tateyamensis]|uniref:MFS transporter n=1 Tax=Streptomyces tateyamensis TaxID=565073 RepID=A0A2V4MZF3_9ACTN|nr:MFS transporter [Streptomyces tateyamensis]PYC71008.1 MFS transporter [Streptomyces tateyamensis]